MYSGRQESEETLNTSQQQVALTNIPQKESISAQYGELASLLLFERLPVQAVNRAKLHILDVIGTALAATRFDFGHHAATGLFGLSGGTGENSVIGMSGRLALRDAALLNGILGHGLDYDDTHLGAIIHPSVSAFPCAFGIAEHIDASGADLITAYILGVDIAVRIGLTARGRMHAKGFHSTGIAGHFGCAVAASKLFKLGAFRTMMAQGLAGSMSAALSEGHRADGAWNKRLHGGWAAVGGITAASLARGGFIGAKRIYEGVDGLFRTHIDSTAGPIDLSPMTADLGERWLIEEVAIKPYPACHYLHACIDSALALRKQHDLSPDDIESVTVFIHPDVFRFVAEPVEVRRRPATDYIAKFSVQYAVAAALTRGTFGFEELEPHSLKDPHILRLSERVSHVADERSKFPKYFSGGVTVVLRDGRSFSHHEAINRGAGDRRLDEDEIVRKFMANAAFALSLTHSERICQCVLDLEHHTARELGNLLSQCH